MLTLVTGVPGAGKTALAVQRFLVPAISDERLVVTNVSLRLHALQARGYDASLVRDLGETHAQVFKSAADFKAVLELRDHRGRGPLVVIDEAHRSVWPEEWKKDGNAEAMLNLFASHRHHGADIVLLTQSAAMLPREILKMAEVLLDCHNLRTYGFSKPGVKVLTKDPTRRSQILHSEVVSWSKNVFSLYASRTSGAHEAEKKIRPWYFRKWGIFVILTAIMAFVSGSWVLKNAGEIRKIGDVNNTTLSRSVEDAPEVVARVPSPVVAPPVGASVELEETRSERLERERQEAAAEREDAFKRLALELQERKEAAERQAVEAAAAREQARADRDAARLDAAAPEYWSLSLVGVGRSGDLCHGLVALGDSRVALTREDVFLARGVAARVECDADGARVVASVLSDAGEVLDWRIVQ